MQHASDSPLAADASGSPPDLLTHLSARGLLPPPDVTPLPGGVSATTTLVERPALRMVVKQSLPKLLVAGDWTAKPERAMTEAAAIGVLSGITPEHVPQLLDADPATNTLVLAAAPPGWANWKSVLLGEVADPGHGIRHTAIALGRLLGTWHARTWHDREVATRFDDYEAFEQLRVAPFHRVVAGRHPRVVPRIDLCIQELETRRDCLVHGDYSPKNVLVGADGFMVLDYEVAHTGAAAFDLAFIQTHLALKAMHRPAYAAEISSAAAALIEAYLATNHAVGDQQHSTAPLQRLGSHIACLLLARVDGLSPAAYLDTATAGRVRDLAIRLLSDAEPSADEVWRHVMEQTR